MKLHRKLKRPQNQVRLIENCSDGDGKTHAGQFTVETARLRFSAAYAKNEQFNWIVKGTLRVKIGDGAEVFASAGTLIYVPANVPHTMIATTEEDVLYFVCKDMSDLIYGKAVDGVDSGPHYDPGFQPEKHVG